MAAGSMITAGKFTKPRRFRMPVTETEEHRAVADFLAVGLGGNAIALHVRNERAGKGERIRAARMGMIAGAPDWRILDCGRAHFVELKPHGWRGRKAAGGKLN